MALEYAFLGQLTLFKLNYHAIYFFINIKARYESLSRMNKQSYYIVTKTSEIL